VAVHAAQYGPFGDPCRAEPGSPGSDRAGGRVGAVDDLDLAAPGFLVGLGPAEADEEALGDLVDIGDGDGGQLGAAHSAGEPDEQDRPVTTSGQGVAEVGDGSCDIRGGDRPFLSGSNAESPADPAHRLADQRIGARVGMPGELVDLADPGQRRHFTERAITLRLCLGP
jgi:hypothetical protein